MPLCPIYNKASIINCLIVGIGYNKVKEKLGDSFIDNLATKSFPSENDIQDFRTKFLILGEKVTTKINLNY